MKNFIVCIVVIFAFVFGSVSARSGYTQEPAKQPVQELKVDVVNMSSNELSLGKNYEGSYKVEVDKTTKETFEVLEIPAKTIVVIEELIIHNYNTQFATPSKLFPSHNGHSIGKADLLSNPEEYTKMDTFIAHEHKGKCEHRCSLNNKEFSKIIVDFEKKGGNKDSEKKKVVIKRKAPKVDYTPYVVFCF